MSIETPIFIEIQGNFAGTRPGIAVAPTRTVSLSKYLPIAIASASLGALAVMAMAPRNAQAQQAPVQVQQAPAQMQPPAPVVQAAPAQPKVDTSAPVVMTNNLAHSKLRTTPEETLPKWVPKNGRLSVVDSSDLAENLGLVPQGATKKTEERISVADKLQEEKTQRAKDPNNYATSFSYSKAGRVRSRL
jgi:hypothetical protein